MRTCSELLSAECIYTVYLMKYKHLFIICFITQYTVGNKLNGTSGNWNYRYLRILYEFGFGVRIFISVYKHKENYINCTAKIRNVLTLTQLLRDSGIYSSAEIPAAFWYAPANINKRQSYLWICS